ncbi:MAG: long-chain fatty acid--CoA ligase [Butyrivibrio sp.]|nr:long-chain fatty acid--CoA ligase [Butyrivibrio sp.]
MRFIDRRNNIYKEATDIVRDVNSMRHVHKYIRNKSPYDMLLELLVAMVSNSEVYLLDSDFTDNELRSLGIGKEKCDELLDVTNKQDFCNTEEIADAVVSEKWKLWLYTSGTTGLPKKVCHNYSTLGRNVRYSDRHKDDIWAFAYKMSHMAGIQVLLQALTNDNSIIYVFEDKPQDVISIIDEERCSNISATPTFYRNMLPFLKDNLPYLKHITLGGERYDENLCIRLQKFVPDAKIHNIYASTETGSLLSSHGSTFTIPSKYKDRIKVSENKELCIHKSLIGDFCCDGDWYNTHDLVEISAGGVIKFLSRKSDLINVGGYKVNPLEVEAIIQQVPNVEDCLVKGEKNSVLGTLLTADIVMQVGAEKKMVKRAIMEKLKDMVQAFKIPRMYHFVDHIEKTRSGKKIRR